MVSFEILNRISITKLEFHEGSIHKLIERHVNPDTGH